MNNETSRDNKDRSTAWYGLWPLDAYALGPFRYKRALSEDEAREDMTKWAGGAEPKQVWPTK